MKRYFILISGIVVLAGLGAFLYFHALSSDVTRGTFAGVSLRLEFATTSAARELGLGGRESLESDYGMLFAFPQPGFYGFWMKDTKVPLDIYWLDESGAVVSMAEGVATSTYPHVFYPAKEALYVLETAAGFGESHAVATGTPLVLKNFPKVLQ